MPRTRTVPCLPCKEKHLKCNGERPICERCKVKGLECRRHSEKTQFIRSGEEEFSKDQKWVRSRVKRFCLDPNVPMHSDFYNLSQSFDSDEGSLSSDESSAGIFNSNKGLAVKTLPFDGADQYATKAPTPPPSAWTNLSRRPDDGLLLLSEALSQCYNEPAAPPSQHSDSSPLVSEQSHPSLTAAAAIRSGSSEYRDFPLKDFQEACLLKYYIDEVAPWFDIADPDRHFELVVPIIARSKPHLLNAIFALSARHILFCSRTSSHESLWYLSQLAARLSPLSVVEYVLQCIPAMRRFDDSLEDEELESIIVVAVLLRQVEQLDRDSKPADRCLQSSQRPAPDGFLGADTFLPVINGILQSSHFRALFHHSGLVQAAYLLVLRQEMYYSMASRRCPAINSTKCTPDTSFIHEVTLHVIQVLQLFWSEPSEAECDRLFRQQDHLENHTLLGIQPIYQQGPDPASDHMLPTIWYSSKTEVYCIQLAKMARAMLTIEGLKARADEWVHLSAPEATKTARSLIIDLHAIAAGRSESPHGTFHAYIMSKIFDDLFTDMPRERRAFEPSAQRLMQMKIWPFKNVVDPGARASGIEY